MRGAPWSLEPDATGKTTNVGSATHRGHAAAPPPGSRGASRDRDRLMERLMPAYTRAVLSELPPVYLKTFLASVLVGVALEDNGWRARQQPLVENLFCALSAAPRRP